jgi:hypothetical protein
VPWKTGLGVFAVIRVSLSSSLPDLIRQSMRQLSMDHRVKPGGDEEGSIAV